MIAVVVSGVLLQDPEIVSLIADRIYPLEIPQGSVYPALRYQGISNTGSHNFDGADNLYTPRLQIDAYAETYLTARALADRVIKVIDGKKFPTPTDDVQGVFFENDTELYESGENLLKLYRVMVDFRIVHKKLN